MPHRVRSTYLEFMGFTSALPRVPLSNNTGQYESAVAIKDRTTVIWDPGIKF